jgi:hypothetical protein
MPPTCCGHSCGCPQRGALQKMDISRCYKILWTSAHIWYVFDTLLGLRHKRLRRIWSEWISPLNAELNHICHLLALLGAHHILHVSRIRVNFHSVCCRNERSVPCVCKTDGRENTCYNKHDRMYSVNVCSFVVKCFASILLTILIRKLTTRFCS